ncbi:MAG: AAA family ATPase [Chloroflexota bacterium]
MKTTVFIMQGGPATGKTTIGLRLAQSLNIPYFSKDGVKEPIFDAVGCPVAWETDEPLSGKKMDDAAISILFYVIAMQLQAGRTCIIDSTFEACHAPTLRVLKSQHPFTPIQILCRAEAGELAKRYIRRAETGERHPGHLDQALSDAFDMEQLNLTYQQPLDIGGHVLSVDSTDFKEEDYQKLLHSIKQLIDEERALKTIKPFADSSNPSVAS